jgi:hypothetical protein
MTESLHCFSFRQLAPFQGFFHIIETQDAQAVTRDGLVWQINVKAIVPSESWGTFGTKIQRRAVLFGFLDQDHAIKRLPINPLVNVEKVERSVQPILDNIAKLAKRLPFKPTDDYELWLLDKTDQQPLVLMASASQVPLAMPKRLRWHATTTSELGFIAPSLHKEIEQGDPTHNLSQGAHLYREAIERLISEAAAPGARWYKRTEAADGIAVNEQGEQISADLTLQKSAFPPCLIRDNWDDMRAANLVADYVRWQAPLLLQLFGLDASTRQKLELFARQAPEKVARCHILYPEIIDQQQINAALVETVMIRAQNT